MLIVELVYFVLHAGIVTNRDVPIAEEYFNAAILESILVVSCLFSVQKDGSATRQGFVIELASKRF